MTNANYDLSTFSKEGKIEDVKIGTKIWYYRDGDEADVGIMISDNDYNIRVKWNSFGKESTINKLGFNCYWGIIMENKQEQTKQEQNRHKYYDVIVHWAGGGEIQYKYRFNDWEDYTPNIFVVPGFCNKETEWRIKPKTQVKRFRTALLKDGNITILHSEPTLEDAYGPTAFLRWIDPEWKEIEVEI